MGACGPRSESCHRLGSLVVHSLRWFSNKSGWLAGWLAGWMDGWMDGCIPVPPDALPLAPGYEKEHLLGRGACAAGGPRCFSFLGLTF